MNPSDFAARFEAAARRCRALDAPLGTRLKALADDVRSFAAPFAEGVDRAVEHLARAGAGELAPLPGQPMPGFMLSDQDGRLVGLADLLEAGPAVIAIDRGHWCPWCQLNVDALVKASPEVARRGGRIAVITPDLARYARSLAADTHAPFPILTDLDHGYALQLGLMVRVERDKRDLMAAVGQDLAAFQGNDTWMFPIPATFVVGRDGRVVARFVDPDYRKRMEIEGILDALSADRG